MVCAAVGNKSVKVEVLVLVEVENKIHGGRWLGEPPPGKRLSMIFFLSSY